jgi:hypothetical protein
MNKYQPSPSMLEGGNSSYPSDGRPGESRAGEPAQRSRRPRAPQFGSDRRRDLDASARANRHSGGRAAEADGNRERRRGLPDRRQSPSQFVNKEVIR